MRCARISKAGLLLSASLLLALSSTGCTPTASLRSAVLPRVLPPAPGWAQPVTVLRPPDGTDWEIVAQREQNGRAEANARIVRFVRWYEERRLELGK